MDVPPTLPTFHTSPSCNSQALFMTLVGNIKTVLVLLLGFVLLGGAPLTLLMAIGKCGKYGL